MMENGEYLEINSGPPLKKLQNCNVQNFYLGRLNFTFAQYARIMMITTIYSVFVLYPIKFRDPEPIGLHLIKSFSFG